MESILTSIKTMLGIMEEYTHYDAAIIMHINSALMDLKQLGVGPEEGFIIEDDSSSWEEFVGEQPKLQAVKTYIYLKVKLDFDPPLNASLLAAMQRRLGELDFRLNAESESF